MAITTTAKLADLLEKVGLFTPPQIEEILARQQQSGMPVADVVVGQGYAREDAFLEKLAGIMSIPFIRVGEVPIEQDILARLPTKAVFQYNVIPHVIGDVKDKLCVVLDDMIDTAGTMCQAGVVLLENGAREVMATATHPVLSGPAIERLENSPFTQIVTTNTIPLTTKPRPAPRSRCSPSRGFWPRPSTISTPSPR